MKDNILLLTFDVGSQSTRGLIFDTKGNLIDIEKVEYPPIKSKKVGYWEVHPDVFYNSICQASSILYERNQEKWDQIIGVSITTLRDTPVFLDKDYNVVRDTILWADQRQASNKFKLPFWVSTLMWIVGLYPTGLAQGKQSRSNWLIEYEPENWKKIEHYWFVSTYLNYKITNNGVDTPSYMIGHIPIDFRKQKYYSKFNMKNHVFNIKKDQLPPLVKTGSIIGYINKETALKSKMKESWPLVSSGSDKGCETVGTGACQSGYASISFGTASSIQFTSKKFVEPYMFLPSYPSVIPNLFNTEIQIYRGYWMINWFKRQFAQRESRRAYILDTSAEKILNQSLTTVPPGCHGLILHPFWGPMLRNPEAKGSIIGFTDYHTKAHVYRAIIEGIGFELYHAFLRLKRRTKQKIHTITVSGGGSQDDTICQINADIFGIPIKKIQTFETSGLGAAIAATVALNVYDSYEEATKNMVHYTKEYIPNKKNHQLYNDLYNRIYKKVYPRLKKLYKVMPKIIDSDVLE
jgi:sugar (pentulose or hexulose) kinase